MLEDTNSLDGAQMQYLKPLKIATAQDSAAINTITLNCLDLRYPNTDHLRLTFQQANESNMSHITREPVFGVCDKVRLEPHCSETQAS